MRNLIGRALITALLVLPVASKAHTAEPAISELQAELKSVQDEILAANKEDQKYVGGLVKSLIAVRIQILKTTEALLQQKIVATKTGAPFKVEARTTQIDPQRAEALEKEILTKKQEIEGQRSEAARYSGGLVLAMKHATIATGEQTLAMLEQQYLVAKYGLPFGPEAPKQLPDNQPKQKASTANQELTEAESILLPNVSNKRFEKLKYQEYMLFDVNWTVGNLEKPARSIKGVLLFGDLFGDVKFQIQVTIDDPIGPGGSVKKNGMAFDYNQFRDEHIWVRSTELSNMTIRFKVTNILYEDGTRKDF